MRVDITNLQGFEVDIRKFAKLLDVKVEKMRDRIGLDVYKRVIANTPRLTGRLAASWQYQYDEINTEVKPPGKYAKPGLPSKRSSNPYSAIFITNALPYAARIEFEGWSHTKAPAGMLGVSMNEVRVAMKQILSGL